MASAITQRSVSGTVRGWDLLTGKVTTPNWRSMCRTSSAASSCLRAPVSASDRDDGVVAGVALGLGEHGLHLLVAGGRPYLVGHLDGEALERVGGDQLFGDEPVVEGAQGLEPGGDTARLVDGLNVLEVGEGLEAADGAEVVVPADRTRHFLRWARV